MERLDERSYEVEAMDGSSYGWNRAHLKQTNELPSELPESPPNRTVFFGRGSDTDNSYDQHNGYRPGQYFLKS